jgi:phage terminase small subunit
MAKDIATKELTEQQSRFVTEYVDSGDARNAMRLAGYSEATAIAGAHRLLTSPHIARAIGLAVRVRLMNDAPMALRVIEGIARNEEINPKVRLDAAKALIDRAGHVAPRATIDRNQSDKPLHELSTDELRAMADRLEGELAERAKPVISAAAAPEEASPTDLIG